MIAPQIIAWLILFVLYWNWRLTVSIVVHSAFSVMYVFLLGYALVAGHISTDTDTVLITGAFACAFGTLLSFPTAVGTITLRSVRVEKGDNSN